MRPYWTSSVRQVVPPEQMGTLSEGGGGRPNTDSARGLCRRGVNTTTTTTTTTKKTMMITMIIKARRSAVGVCAGCGLFEPLLVFITTINYY